MKPILYPTQLKRHSLPPQIHSFCSLFMPAGLLVQSNRPYGLGFDPEIPAQNAKQFRASESEDAPEPNGENSLMTTFLQEMEVSCKKVVSQRYWKPKIENQYQEEKEAQLLNGLTAQAENIFVNQVSTSYPEGKQQFSNSIQVRKSDKSINYFEERSTRWVPVLATGTFQRAAYHVQSNRPINGHIPTSFSTPEIVLAQTNASSRHLYFGCLNIDPNPSS